MAEPTGVQIARKAFREPFESIGWKPRAAGWFTKDLGRGWTGVVCVTHSNTGNPAIVDVSLNIDLRHDDVEQQAANFVSIRSDYKARTILRQLHQLCPKDALPASRLNAHNAPEVAAAILAAFIRYGQPWLEDVAADDTLALDLTSRAVGGSTMHVVRYVLFGEALGGADERYQRLLRVRDYIMTSRLGWTRETTVNAFETLAEGTGIELPERAQAERPVTELEMYRPILASAEVIAADLRAYGEPAAAAWILVCSNDDLARVCAVASWLIYNGPTAKDGSSMFLATALSLAAIYIHEAAPRDLKRARRVRIEEVPSGTPQRFPSSHGYTAVAQNYPVRDDARAYWARAQSR
ncbi:hypothetical protein Back2_20160 [Nocardioides baekrokdamisoli]|uniref:Uncharacterized protein n=1 Tax=Nocardioides baekrokdamisoli TaxID=1804624 RepID=A0A3G9J3Y7_9ACTN|nr:hypothetical protein [Nocardioides baekrokdamisoli]BBH17729.1 hypothetical protein Back2_20160 [Nocardioides baekrokdamisoli]